MSVLARQQQSDGEQAWRACLQQRPRLLRALQGQFPAVGSLEIEEAVDTAMSELLEKGTDPHALQRMWPQAARLNVIDAIRAPRVHQRDGASIEEHELLDEERESPSEEVRGHYRMAELLAQLSGDERRWAQTVLTAPAEKNKPGHFIALLGWPDWRYRRVAKSARAQLLTFIAARSDGTLCRRRQAVLEAFAAMHLHRAGPREGELDQDEYRATLLHVQGCVMCERQWRQHERALHDARHILAPAPFLIALLTVARTKLAVSLATVRTRSGTAGGGAAGGGVAAALGGKGAAVICAGAICATAAAGTALVGGVPAVFSAATHGRTTHYSPHRTPLRKVARAQTASVTTAPSTPAVATRAPVINTTPPSTSPRSTRSSSHKQAHVTRATPGDLILAASSPGPSPSHASTAAQTASIHTSSPSNTASASPHASYSSATPKCTPGDLTC